MTAQYTYSEARQNLASLLDQAASEGEVKIKRRDGAIFVIRPEPRETSPLDVGSVPLALTTEQIVALIRESRKTYLP